MGKNKYHHKHTTQPYKHKKFRKASKKYYPKNNKFRNQKNSQIKKSRDSSSYSKRYNHSSYSRSSYSSNSSKSSSNSKSSVSSLSSAAKRHRVQHFQFIKGQMLKGKYIVKKLLGDGTFGRVVKCQYQNKKYAVKIIKPVQKYINSAKIQRSIIKRVNQKDQYDQFGIVRYVESFYHRKHFCMVFQRLGKSLYDFIKMNNFRGFPLPLIQSIFKQTLKSIGFLHRIGYTHTDLKLQNILFEKTDIIEANPNIPYRAPQSVRRYYNPNQDKKYYLPASDKIRIIDFGGATRFDDHHSSIINTRQYRAPEVILQCCKWKDISDIWAIGCIICELYTGDLLFPAYDDREHIAMIEKNSGKFPSWMLNKIPSSHPERKLFMDGFVNQQKLEHVEEIIGMQIIQDIFPEQKQLIQLIRLCLEIDPNKRITCHQALRHPFFSVKFQ